MNKPAVTEQKVLRSFLLKNPMEILWLIWGSFIFLIGYLELRVILSLRKAGAFCDVRRNENKKRALLLERLPEIKFQLYNGDLPKETDERLATQRIKIISDINWSYPYADQEDSFALNRFGWLLCSLLRYPSPLIAEAALKNILSWISEMGDTRQGPAWESYSVAERLANWPFILLIVKKIMPIPDEALAGISRSMGAQLDHLMGNLEYNGRFTNNHLLNDARGLYIGGTVLNDERALQKAREIFFEWTKKMFYPDGMLRDGSSHYQYLLCQRYEQVYRLAHYRDDRVFSGFMEKWVCLMRESCDLFSVHDKDHSWRMPMFGDISPDFIPQWFSPNGKAGWKDLKTWLNWNELGDPVIKESTGYEHKGDFLRFDAGDVVIFWRVARENAGYLDHGHYDLGSFVLFYKGIQICADPGRASYDTKHAFAKSAKAHSSLLIDSVGAWCEDPKLNLLNAYHSMRTCFNTVRSDECFSLGIKSEGFKRLPVPVEWSRKFSVYADRMVIADELKSVGKNRIENRFHVGPGLKIAEEKDGISICDAPNILIRLKVADPFEYKCSLIGAGTGSTDEGGVSQEYGASSPAPIVTFQRMLSSAQTYVYEIRWQNVNP